jgi:hypothetical protein
MITAMLLLFAMLWATFIVTMIMDQAYDAGSSSRFRMSDKFHNFNTHESLYSQQEWYTAMLADISSKCKHISNLFHHFLLHKQCHRPVRVGNCKDGSKWICMDDFMERTTKLAILQDNRRCIVYSFGSSDDSCFEEAVAEATDCDIFIFDPTSSELRDDRWTYLPYGLTGKDPSVSDFWDWRTQSRTKCDGCRMKNLKEIMAELGHQWIDILKVDIDGAEWRSFEYAFQVMHTLPASQIQIELTGLDISDQPDSLANGTQGVFQLWKNLMEDGFRIFHLEPNVGTCKRRDRDRAASFEYALWR